MSFALMTFSWVVSYSLLFENPIYNSSKSLLVLVLCMYILMIGSIVQQRNRGKIPGQGPDPFASVVVFLHPRGILWGQCKELQISSARDHTTPF
jgi:hypothetical protein